EGAIIFTTRLLERMRAAESTIPVPTVSAGIASYRPEMESYEELVGDARAALEQAKRDGGDRFRIHGRSNDAAGSDMEGATSNVVARTSDTAVASQPGDSGDETAGSAAGATTAIEAGSDTASRDASVDDLIAA